MSYRVLLYGANGFTGQLMATTAMPDGIAVTLAGRDRERVANLARHLGLPWLGFSLDDADLLRQILRDFDVVLNCAGPFSKTALPLAWACIQGGAHYLDVTGEPDVFLAMMRLSEKAEANNVMLMPGVGFVILASDCLAAHVAGCLPKAQSLRLGFSKHKLMSRGTFKTTMEQIAGRALVLRQGCLVTEPTGRLQHSFDFGRGQKTAIALRWADVCTAYHTTGIPNIEAYLEADLPVRSSLSLLSLLDGLLHAKAGRRLLQLPVRLWPKFPEAELRTQTPRVIVAEAEDRGRHKVLSRLMTPDGYDFTPYSSWAVVQRLANGEFAAGFQTPGKVYGPDLAFAVPGVSRENFHPQRGWTSA